jgi:hypothetical protein
MIKLAIAGQKFDEFAQLMTPDAGQLRDWSATMTGGDE